MIREILIIYLFRRRGDNNEEILQRRKTCSKFCMITVIPWTKFSMSRLERSPRRLRPVNAFLVDVGKQRYGVKLGKYSKFIPGVVDTENCHFNFSHDFSHIQSKEMSDRKRIHRGF